MQIKRFLGNIARVYLAIGSLSMATVAGANEFYNEPVALHDGYAQDGFVAGGFGNDGYAQDGFVPGGFQDGCCNHCCVNEAPTCGWGYNPPGYLKCGSNACESFLDTLRFRVDFLWWRADEQGLDLGTEQLVDRFVVDSDLSEYTKEFKTKKPNTTYDPGFRIGLSSICENCWDIGLNWTHFHTTAKARGASDFSEAPANYTFFESCWEAREGLIPDFAKAHWKLDLDMLDLEFGHKFYVDHCFILRPNAGLRGIRLDQKYRVFSAANRTSGAFSTQQFDAHVHARNDFLGIGPRVGLDLEYKFECGVSIFGQAAGTLAFGRFNRNATEFSDDFGSDFDTLVKFKDRSYRTSRAITDLAIGLKWDHCFEWCCRCHPVSIAFTWEHHAFFNFNNFNFKKNSVDPTAATTADDLVATECCSCGGDLYTQGLTVSFEIGF
jgi:hypothetical protein